jgi:hypothetical protein
LQFSARRRGAWLLLERVGDAVNTIDLELLLRIVVVLRAESIRRVGEVERTVGLVDEIVGAVQFLALIGVGKNCEWSFWVE